MNYAIHLLVYFEIYVIVALSLNLVVGYCGMLSLAHAAYYAIGAYAYTLIILKLGFGFLPAAAVAVSIAAFLSLLVSLPSWRLKGDFFILITLAVQSLIYSLAYNWSAADAPIGTWKNLTNGSFGIAGIPEASVLGVVFDGPVSFVLLSTVITGVCAMTVWRLTFSPWGRVIVAMREDELSARSLGKNTRFLKVQALAVSCGLAAIAGVLYVSHVSYLDPSSASLGESIMMLSVVVVGGTGNFKGPVVGAFVVVALPELLRFADFPDRMAANVRLGIYGLLLVLMMHFRPQGICGEYRRE